MSYARWHHCNELKANGEANLMRLLLMSSPLKRAPQS